MIVLLWFYCAVWELVGSIIYFRAGAVFGGVVVLSVIIPCRDSIQQWFTLCTDTVRSSHTVLTEIPEDTLYSVYSPNFLSVVVTVVFIALMYIVHKRHLALIEQ